MRCGGYKNIVLEVRDGIATLTINRPEVLNAMDSETRREMLDAVRELAGRNDVRVLIITGAGRAFSSGQDVREASEFNSEDVGNWLREWNELYQAIINLEIPIIAKLKGYAIGAGFQIALLSDVRVSAENCKFGLGEINVGIPCILGSYILSKLIGFGRTTKLVLTGELVDAVEAERLGIVHMVVPEEELDRVVSEIARSLATKSRTAIRLNRIWFRSFWREFKEVSEQAVRLHREAYKSGEPQRLMKEFVEGKR